MIHTRTHTSIYNEAESILGINDLIWSARDNPERESEEFEALLQINTAPFG
jgi:hypothetical protein